MATGTPREDDPVSGDAVAAGTSFSCSLPDRIVFGAGTIRECGQIAQEFGLRPLVLTGRTPERAESLLTLLSEYRMTPVTYTIAREPDIDIVREGTALARERGCDCAIGFGGGSVLDAAKAIAILTTNEGDVLDYLEIVGKGMALAEPPLPLIAVPTTAGTGTEATGNSVIKSPEHHVKVSLRSPLMLPAVALVDPELTYGLPPTLTATTGLDALTQLIEPFVSRRANPLTDSLCREGMGRAARSLPQAFAGEDPAAREGMAVASLFSGIALANAGLGAVHGLAGPLGGMIDAPHGALCAALLPSVVETNLEALHARSPESPALAHYAEVARILTGDRSATADGAGRWLRDLTAGLQIPPLSKHGLTARQIPELVKKAQAASSMKGNPVQLTGDELAHIVESAL